MHKVESFVQSQMPFIFWPYTGFLGIALDRIPIPITDLCIGHGNLIRATIKAWIWSFGNTSIATTTTTEAKAMNETCQRLKIADKPKKREL